MPAPDSTGQRNRAADAARGIGILLVVWGHCSARGFSQIYAFHMPLFFFLSGCFLKLHEPWLLLVRKKSCRLLLPYWLFIFLSCFYYWALLALTGRWQTRSLAYLQDLVPFDSQILNAPLWFLVALFWATALYAAVRRLVTSELLVTAVVVALHLVARAAETQGVRVPLFLGRSFYEVVYLHLGYMAHRRGLLWRVQQAGVARNVAVTAGCVAVFALLFPWRAGAGAAVAASVGLALAVAGTVACLAAGAALTRCWGANSTLAFLGRNSLCLFAVHLPLLEVGRPVAKRLFAQGALGHDVVVFGVVLSLSVAASGPLGRLFPRILGTRSDTARPAV
jgi:acyltransferase